MRQAGTRLAITEAYRRPEPDCVAALLADAALTPEQAAAARARAQTLVTCLRARHRPGGIEALIREYSLSSTEGVALMCLAEALLRIPDSATRDALIRDQLGRGDWRAHLGHSPSLFVNAATWGLMISGNCSIGAANESGQAPRRAERRGGEPLIRKGVDTRHAPAWASSSSGPDDRSASHAPRHGSEGFRYSYDMLGEAALTAEDAARYRAAYEKAIIAIGAASTGRGIFDGPAFP